MDPENPAKLVTIPQIVSKDEDMVFLTVPEVELLVRFLAYTGVRNAGMEGEAVNIHSLRHTYASIAIACGADVKTLQKQLGHATASITLEVYAGLWPE